MERFQTISRRAHAKINLVLAVADPLPAGHPQAGMHPIESVMTCVDLADDLTVSRVEGESRYEIRADPRSGIAIDWPLERDLVVRAHRALERHVDRPLPVELRLIKRVPVGGGLGGGSSDAAAALMATNELFGLERPLAELHAIAETLGSDIPFFIDDDAKPVPPPALVSGLGGRIERFPSRTELDLILIRPPFGCPTGDVYRVFDERCRLGMPRAAAPGAARCLVDAMRGDSPPDESLLANDLAEAAIEVRPTLGDIRERLVEAGGRPVHISGSGSTMFVLIDPRSDAHAAVRAAAEEAGCRCLEARTISAR